MVGMSATLKLLPAAPPSILTDRLGCATTAPVGELTFFIA